MSLGFINKVKESSNVWRSSLRAYVQCIQVKAALQDQEQSSIGKLKKSASKSVRNSSSRLQYQIKYINGSHVGLDKRHVDSQVQVGSFLEYKPL